MNNPFDYEPTEECLAAYRHLCQLIDTLKDSKSPEDRYLCRELSEGKMLGVLIARDSDGKKHQSFAFSGQIGVHGFRHRCFVGPVFDYLEPGGYFKKKEREISTLNETINQFQLNEYSRVKSEYKQAKEEVEKEIASCQEFFRESKEQRRLKRATERLTEAELSAIIRQSQFEKAELKRIKKRLTEWLKPFEEKFEAIETRLLELKEQRRVESENLQQWLFSNFRLLNGRGETRTLSEIFAETTFKVPPSGAGECCAPKLLQAAYSKGWRPLSMAEFWYGKPKGGELRIEGHYYPACRGKCLPVLTWMLEGITLDKPLESFESKNFEPEIIFENEWFCVVDKPSGMLSVPGKEPEESLQDWLIKKYGGERNVKVAHRLDQDTSGIIIAGFGDFAYKTIQSLFASRQAKKSYIAVLDGDYRNKKLPEDGRIELPLSPDWLDRPRQRVDLESGKPSLTAYEFIKIENGRSRIKLFPHTGRTHQLRVHCASEDGLGMPIVGDRLYGKGAGKDGDRLMLHAHKLEFSFPIDGKHYSFDSPVPF